MGLVLQLPKLKKVLSALFGIWLIIAIFAVVIVARGQYMPCLLYTSKLPHVTIAFS